MRNQPRRGELSKEEDGLDELVAPPPDQNVDRRTNLESKPKSTPENEQEGNELSREESGLDELFAPPPDENPTEGDTYRHSSLEERQSQNLQQQRSQGTEKVEESPWAQYLTQLYIYSYLVLFSILGVLARVGLQALTLYPGALVPNTDLWANFGGCLVIGFLREDRTLFRRHWTRAQNQGEKQTDSSERSGPGNTDDDTQETDMAAVKKAYRASRAGVPGYLGLTVGFCGSFTSFASICRDAFLAVSNNIDTDSSSNHFVTAQMRSRDAGYSVMALLAVLLLEIGLSMVALNLGSHLAVFTEGLCENVSGIINFGEFLDPLSVFLGWGIWIGAIILTIFSPYDVWRGQILFSLVFAPVGCMLRFQLSVRMNRLVSSFPLGTFASNVFGTAVLGMTYDLQRSSAVRSMVGCQVLQGIEDGFCGALTTVSTWALELDTLRLGHAYAYGGCSIFIAVGCITAIMGPLRWTEGFMTPVCSS